MDYIGKTSGTLTILDIHPVNRWGVFGVVMCECGAVDIIKCTDVVNGNSTSCRRFVNYKVDCGEYYQVFAHSGDYTLVDKNDYKKYFSNRSINIDSVGYAFISVNNRTRLHRIIMGNPNGMDIDHINGDRLDNRKANLRIVTRHQNLMNTKKNKDSTSKYKGVCWIKTDKTWLAYCNKDGERVYREKFDNELEAAKAYDIAALKYHGEFAKTNEMLGLFA